jgi:hypothetical protein
MHVLPNRLERPKTELELILERELESADPNAWVGHEYDSGGM